MYPSRACAGHVKHFTWGYLPLIKGKAPLHAPSITTEKMSSYRRRLVGDRVQKRWLSYGLTQWFESVLFDL
jgi:hypothetical protein